MAFGDKLGNQLREPDSKQKQPRERRPIKTSRIKYIVISGILLVSAVCLLVFMLWAKGGTEKDVSEEETENLYSASRYFCRVKYPDDWDVTTGENGFYMNKDTGLIFQLYPFTTEAGKAEPPKSAAPSAATPEPVKIRTEGVLVSVYYQAVPDFSWPATEAPKEGATPTPVPEKTSEPTPAPAAFDLQKALERSVSHMKETVLPAAAGDGGPDYAFSAPKTYEGKNCSFQTCTYAYTDQEGREIKGEMYVCSRAMAYYIVTYEAGSELFGTYQKDFQGMVNNFILSVFAY